MAILDLLVVSDNGCGGIGRLEKTSWRSGCYIASVDGIYGKSFLFIFVHFI
jgi:hypothetical protein